MRNEELASPWTLEELIVLPEMLKQYLPAGCGLEAFPHGSNPSEPSWVTLRGLDKATNSLLNVRAIRVASGSLMQAEVLTDLGGEIWKVICAKAEQWHKQPDAATLRLSPRRGANEGTLEACEQALENWLDKDIGFTQAAKTVTPKTVRARIPDVLRRVRARDPDRCSRWVAEIQSRGRSKFLGDFR